MKFKIKYTSTRKFVLNFDGSTVDELLAAVIAFIANTYGEESANLSLSLNGKDPLPSGPNMSLADAGVVASDILTVIEWKNEPPVGGGGGIPTAGGDSGAPTAGGGSGAPTAGGGSGVPTAGKAVSGAGGTATAHGADADGGKGGDAGGAGKPEMFEPTSLLEVRPNDGNSGTSVVPESLTYTLSHCRPKSQIQVVVLLCHITFVECGFVASGNAAGKVPASKLEPFLPPAGWDSAVANLAYSHKSYAGFSCTLVFVPMGECLQILVSFAKQDVEISTKVFVKDYTEDFSEDHPVSVEDLRNVSKLARKLRNELLVPLQLAAHRILDLPSPFHLAGLPSEILLSIVRLLDVRAVLNVSETCRRLRDSCMDDALWQHLYRRDLGTPPSSMGDGPRWVALYRERHQQRKSFNIGWRQPVPPYIGDFPQPRIYPTGPLHPSPPGYPYQPNPVGPYPVVPDPSHPFNPYRDPDSPYFGGDIPNQPPYPLNPGGPGIGPLGPIGPDPLNPFGDPQFGGLGPGLPRRPQNPRGPGSGPGFRYI